MKFGLTPARVDALLLLVFSLLVACRNAYELSDLMSARRMKPDFPVAEVHPRDQRATRMDRDDSAQFKTSKSIFP